MTVPPPKPRPRPRPDPRSAFAQKAARLKWGWIEWFILSQTILSGLLFVPGISPVRTLIRVSSYLFGVVALLVVWQRGKLSAGSTSFPARSWLVFSGVWLFVSLLHPHIYSIPAAVGQVALYLSILSPAFWAGEEVRAPRQLNRIMAILFLGNALSASVGLAQVFSERFNPPVIPADNDVYKGEGSKITVDGRRIYRPCGLTDSPGAAAMAGSTAALIGLCFALQPVGVLRRLVCAGLSFVGVAVIYYSQIRSMLIVLVICLSVMTVFLFIRGRVAAALTLSLGGASMIVASLLWVARRMGDVVERFGTLLTSDQATLYNRNRGGYVRQALENTLWENPLGHGMGWWGMVHGLFFDPARLSPVWVEVMIQAWVIDGGFPLLIGYFGAILVAVANTFRIALRSKDRDLAFWAAVVLAMDVSTVALCFSCIAFLSPIGLQFWLLNAAVHAADFQARGAESNPLASASARVRRRFRPSPPGRAAT